MNLRVTAEANASPTRCFMCGDHGGPFVDTRIDMPVYGHLWICCGNETRPGCARQVGRLDGMFDPEERVRLLDEIGALEDLVSKQEKLIKQKNVPVGDILEAIRS